MSRISIPLDPLNPGQFYACCGLIELFDMTGAQVQSCFAVSEDRPGTAEFQLSSHKDLDLNALLAELRGAAFECVDHAEQAVKPIRLTLPSGEITLDWWLDCFRGRTVSIKCWAGQVTTEKLITELLPSVDPATEADHLFSVPV